MNLLFQIIVVISFIILLLYLLISHLLDKRRERERFRPDLKLREE